MIQINSKAPDFKLYNTEKKEVALSSLRGKNVLLLFFPLAFTSTCTTELCNIRDNYQQYNDLNATVFGISTDSLFALKKFKEEQNLSFDLLSDYNKEVSAAYGALYAEWGFGMKGVTKRAAFVIDSNGTVKYAEVLENAGDLPDFDAFNKVLKEINA